MFLQERDECVVEFRSLQSLCGIPKEGAMQIFILQNECLYIFHARLYLSIEHLFLRIEGGDGFVARTGGLASFVELFQHLHELVDVFHVCVVYTALKTIKKYARKPVKNKV